MMLLSTAELPSVARGPRAGRARVRRLPGNPILRPELLAGEAGRSLCGPSLIRVPSWLERPLGRYYLYFAHHHGDAIRLAVADALEGPWHLHPGGVLGVGDVACIVGHVASPDAVVDDERREIRLFAHGRTGENSQGTFGAVSRDGLRFELRTDILGGPYWRVFRYAARWYALEQGGRLWRATDGLEHFELGPNLFFDDPRAQHLAPRRPRHHAVQVLRDALWVYYSRIWDRPERILRSRVPLGQDWREWRAEPPEEVLAPEHPWEGAERPLVHSTPGIAREPLHGLRDPGVLVDADGRTCLLWAVAGESGIAIGELTEDAAPSSSCGGDTEPELRPSERRKTFCIGLNKTGTSSLGQAFQMLGLVPIAAPSNRDPAARGLARAIMEEGNYRPALDYARDFVSFEDRPWNVAEIYRHLDAEFPGSRFVLTVRDKARWWNSVQSWLELKTQMRKTYLRHLGASELTEAEFCAAAARYEASVREYFQGRSSLLVMDLEAGDGWEKLCAFLELPVPGCPFPHANRQRRLDAAGAAPTVSVLIPVRDSAHTLARAIESALIEEHPSREVVVVDDGSSDGVGSLLAAFADRIRFERAARRGTAAVRNRLLELSRGEWLKFLDADDVLLPGALERQVAAGEACGADLVVAPCVDERGRLRHAPEGGDPWCCWLQSRLGVTSANLFRRAAVLRAGGWEIGRRSSQEYELMARMLRDGALVAMQDAPACLKFESPTSVWRTDMVGARRGAAENIAASCRWLDSRGEFGEARRRAAGARFLRLARDTRRTDPSAARELLKEARGIDLAKRHLLSESRAGYRVIFRLLGFSAGEMLRRERLARSGRRARRRLLRLWRDGAHGLRLLRQRGRAAARTAVSALR